MSTLTLIKLFIAAVIIGIAAYFVYDYIYDYGYSVAEQKYTKIIDEYNENQDKKIESLQSSMESLIVAMSGYNSVLLTDMNKIKASISNKTLVVYKDGKCGLTQDYLDARMEAIKRANQR